MEFQEMVTNATRGACDVVLGTPVDGGTRTHNVVDPETGKQIQRGFRFAIYKDGSRWFQYDGGPGVALVSPIEKGSAK